MYFLSSKFILEGYLTFGVPSQMNLTFDSPNYCINYETVDSMTDPKNPFKSVLMYNGDDVHGNPTCGLPCNGIEPCVRRYTLSEGISSLNHT